MWKQSFSPLILARGNGIQEDAVIFFENEQDIIRSKVEGTQVYQITIDLNQEIETSQCTCPYFQSGGLCVERQIKSAGKSRIKIRKKLRFLYLNDLKSLYYIIKSQIIIV